MDREARIKLIAEGAGRAASDVRSVSSEVSGLGKAADKAQGALKEVGKAAFRMASDAARAMNDVRPLNFSQAADTAKRFDDVVTRMAVRANRDVGQLKIQFRDTGRELGIMPDRIAQASRALTKMTGSAEAADAMKALGEEANDTDRSIEEMGDLGATLFNKLGVPMNKIGDAIERVKGVAADFQNVGGRLALEDSLVRLGPLLARFQGTVGQAAATLAVLGQGKSKEVGEHTSEAILGAFAHADPLLVTRKTRQLFHNPHYNPFVTNEQGQDVIKRDALIKLQQHFRKLPFGAVLRFFGNDVTAARTFVDSRNRLELVEEAEKRTEATRKALVGEGAMDLEHLRPSDIAAIREYDRKVQGLQPKPSGLAATEAGERARTDVERSDVELEAGEVIQRQADKRNRMYRGQRHQQAGIDTIKHYLPTTWERATDVVEAVAADNASNAGGAGAPTSRTDRLTVDLSPQSIQGVARAVQAAPPVVRPARSPAAQAVEDSKAKGRVTANY